MRVGINALFLGREGTGSGQYTAELLRALRQIAPEHEYLCLSPSAKCSTHLVSLPSSHLGSNLAKLWFEQVLYPRECRRLAVDVAHTPYFAPPLRPTVPTVVTIHDVIPLILPQYRGSPLVRMYMRLVSAAAHRAQIVLTDSEASKRDIVRVLGIDPERVRVVYLAASERYRPVQDKGALDDTRARYSLPDAYILYLGGFDPRKNVDTLLRAYSQLTDAPPLVVAGRLPEQGSALAFDPRPLVEALEIEERVRFIGWVSEEDKPALYTAAWCLVFPSLYEGFGLPPLEAMACGTPVVASDTSSLPEVVGDGGLLVNPTSATQIAEALGALWANPGLRAELAARALVQATRFTWERTAKETLATYEALT